MSWYYCFLRGCVLIWLLLWVFSAHTSLMASCCTSDLEFLFFSSPHMARFQGPLLAAVVAAWITLSVAQAFKNKASMRYLLGVNLLGLWSALFVFAQPAYKPLYAVLFVIQALVMFLRNDFRRLQAMGAPPKFELGPRGQKFSWGGWLALGIALMICFPWALLPMLLLGHIFDKEPDYAFALLMCTLGLALVPIGIYGAQRLRRPSNHVFQGNLQTVSGGAFRFFRGGLKVLFWAYGGFAILSQFLLPICNQRLGGERFDTARSHAYTLQSRLEIYISLHQRYPSHLAELSAEPQARFAPVPFLNPYDRRAPAVQAYETWQHTQAQPLEPVPTAEDYTDVLGLRIYPYAKMFIEVMPPPPVPGRGSVLYRYVNPQAYILYVVKPDGTLWELLQS